MRPFPLALVSFLVACGGPTNPPSELMDQYTLAKQLARDAVNDIAAMDQAIAAAETKNDLKLRLSHLKAKAMLIDRKVDLESKALELEAKLKDGYGWTDPDPLQP